MEIKTDIMGPDKIIVRCTRSDYMNEVVPLHNNTNTLALLELIDIIVEQTKKHEKDNLNHTGEVTLSGGLGVANLLLQS